MWLICSSSEMTNTWYLPEHVFIVFKYHDLPFQSFFKVSPDIHKLSSRFFNSFNFWIVKLSFINIYRKIKKWKNLPPSVQPTTSGITWRQTTPHKPSFTLNLTAYWNCDELPFFFSCNLTEIYIEMNFRGINVMNCDTREVNYEADWTYPGFRC